MVLPVRIELTTSALPRMRSTTELRQHSISSPWRHLRFGGRAYGRPRRPCQGGLRRIMHFAYARPMADTQDEKKARLAQGLRDNLRRRKAQSREAVREEAAPPPPPDTPET